MLHVSSWPKYATSGFGMQVLMYRSMLPTIGHLGRVFGSLGWWAGSRCSSQPGLPHSSLWRTVLSWTSACPSQTWRPVGPFLDPPVRKHKSGTSTCILEKKNFNTTNIYPVHGLPFSGLTLSPYPMFSNISRQLWMMACNTSWLCSAHWLIWARWDGTPGSMFWWCWDRLRNWRSARLTCSWTWTLMEVSTCDS